MYFRDLGPWPCLTAMGQQMLVLTRVRHAAEKYNGLPIMAERVLFVSKC